MNTKWAIISRLVKEKNQGRQDDHASNEREIEPHRYHECTIGEPFDVKRMSHVEFDKSTNTMIVTGIPLEWAEALASKLSPEGVSPQDNANGEHTPKEHSPLPENLTNLRLTWDPNTGEFQGLPLEWRLVLADLEKEHAELEDASTKKKLLEEQLERRDEEEKERRKTSRMSLLPPIDTGMLNTLLRVPSDITPQTSVPLTPSTPPAHLQHHGPELLFLSAPDMKETNEKLYYFKDVGKEFGVETWRLEGKVPVPVPFSTLIEGKLRTGDCYIFLQTCEDSEDSETGGEQTSPIRHDLFFWLGSNAPMDLKALAAFRSVELKTLLSKRYPVNMHREEQGDETPEFEAIFSQPIQYLEGGTVSGLVTIRDQYIPRLFQIRGTIEFRMKRVEPSYTSLNHADVFILDTGPRIFIWCGRKAPIQKQVRSCEIATKIKYETMKCRGAVEILDSDEPEPEFWAPLGGFHDITNLNSDGSTDEAIKKEEENSTHLYRVLDSGEIVRVPDRPLVPTLLDSNLCFILDCQTEVYIWNGKTAGNLKQSVAIILAKEFRTVFSDRPPWVTTTTIFEGEEPLSFRGRFAYWDEKIVLAKKTPARVQTGSMKGKEFDVMKMMAALPPPPRPGSIPPSSTPSTPSQTPLSPSQTLAQNHTQTPSSPSQNPSSPSQTPSQTPSQNPSSPSQTLSRPPSQTLSETPSLAPSQTPSSPPQNPSSPSQTLSETPSQPPSQTPSSPSQNPSSPSQTPAETPSETPSELPRQASSEPLPSPSQTPLDIPQTPSSQVSMTIPFPSSPSSSNFTPLDIALGSPATGNLPPSKSPAHAWSGLKKLDAVKFDTTLYAWKSTNAGWEEMEEADYGQFYSNRCYVYHEVRTPEFGRCQSTVYFWQGIIAANRFWISFKFEILPEIENRMQEMDGITPGTIQLQQHKEVPAFLDLFQGKIIYHESSRGFNVRLYQVKTDNSGRLRAAQCNNADLSSLNSGDSFIFWNFVRTSFTIWHGKGSPLSTRTFALSVVETLRTSCLPNAHDTKQYTVKEVEEGKENYAFWQHANVSVAVGERVELRYSSDAWLRDPKRRAPRLFVCHEDLFSGLFTVTYSPHMCQSLMGAHDVVIVDAFAVVFVWFGIRSSQYKREMGSKTAAAYVAKSTLGHSPTTPIITVNEGQEPMALRAQFLSWRQKAADYVDPFPSRPITPKMGTHMTKDSGNFLITTILRRRSMYGGKAEDEEEEDDVPRGLAKSTSKSKLSKNVSSVTLSMNSSTNSLLSPTASPTPSHPSSHPLARGKSVGGGGKPSLSVEVMDLENAHPVTLSLPPGVSIFSPTAGTGLVRSNSLSFQQHKRTLSEGKDKSPLKGSVGEEGGERERERGGKLRKSSSGDSLRSLVKSTSDNNLSESAGEGGGTRKKRSKEEKEREKEEQRRRMKQLMKSPSMGNLRQIMGGGGPSPISPSSSTQPPSLSRTQPTMGLLVESGAAPSVASMAQGFDQIVADIEASSRAPLHRSPSMNFEPPPANNSQPRRTQSNRWSGDQYAPGGPTPTSPSSISSSSSSILRSPSTGNLNRSPSTTTFEDERRRREEAKRSTGMFKSPSLTSSTTLLASPSPSSPSLSPSSQHKQSPPLSSSLSLSHPLESANHHHPEPIPEETEPELKGEEGEGEGEGERVEEGEGEGEELHEEEMLEAHTPELVEPQSESEEIEGEGEGEEGEEQGEAEEIEEGEEIEEHEMENGREHVAEEGEEGEEEEGEAHAHENGVEVEGIEEEEGVEEEGIEEHEGEEHEAHEEHEGEQEESESESEEEEEEEGEKREGEKHEVHGSESEPEPRAAPELSESEPEPGEEAKEKVLKPKKTKEPKTTGTKTKTTTKKATGDKAKTGTAKAGAKTAAGKAPAKPGAKTGAAKAPAKPGAKTAAKPGAKTAAKPAAKTGAAAKAPAKPAAKTGAAAKAPAKPAAKTAAKAPAKPAAKTAAKAPAKPAAKVGAAAKAPAGTAKKAPALGKAPAAASKSTANLKAPAKPAAKPAAAKAKPSAKAESSTAKKTTTTTKPKPKAA